MSSTTEANQEGGAHKWGPQTEEERQKHEAAFKQAFLDEYKKQHGDSTISAAQTLALYHTVRQDWHAKTLAHRHEQHQHHGHQQHQQHHESAPHHDQQDPSHHPGHSPTQPGEQHKQFQEELEADFQKEYAAAHGTGNVNAEQAWAVLYKVKENKRQRDEAQHGHGHKHGHGHGHGHAHGQHEHAEH
jgi:hypothetical protein